MSICTLRRVLNVSRTETLHLFQHRIPPRQLVTSLNAHTKEAFF